MKKICMVLVAVLLLGVCSCALAEADVYIKLSDEGCSCTARTVLISGSTVTILMPGEYQISGTLTNGQLRVECEAAGKVTLFFDNVNITNEEGTALYIGKVSPRLSISTLADTINTLTGCSAHPLEEGVAEDGVIYSRSDLTITGEGVLKIVTPYMNGIVSKDDLRIKGGTLTVDAGRNGICGKDAVEIYDGTIEIHAGKDGIRSTNSKDANCGYIDITGGKITMTYGDDAFDFENYIHMSDCQIDAVAIK